MKRDCSLEGFGPRSKSDVIKLCQSTSFGLMVDETTDRKVDKQMAILARLFVDDAVVTIFIDMPTCNLATAEDLFNTIDKVFRYS